MGVRDAPISEMGDSFASFKTFTVTVVLYQVGLLVSHYTLDRLNHSFQKVQSFVDKVQPICRCIRGPDHHQKVYRITMRLTEFDKDKLCSCRLLI